MPNAEQPERKELDQGSLAWLHEASAGRSNDGCKRPGLYASPKSRSNIKRSQRARSFVGWNPEGQRRRSGAT